MLLTQEQFLFIGSLKTLELKLIDERFSQRGAIDIKDSCDVIILEITQHTYDQIPHPYKDWPWPRFIFNNVIENLEDAGVRAIGIDILMSNSDKFSLEYDSLMIHTIRKYGNIVEAGKVDIAAEARISSGNQQFQVTQFVDSNYSEIKENFQNIFFAVIVCHCL